MNNDKLRKAVYKITDGHCAYCGIIIFIDSDWHMDHIIPRSMGGGWGIENRYPACARCNIRKSFYDPEGFKSFLKRQILKKLSKTSKLIEEYSSFLPESSSELVLGSLSNLLLFLEHSEIEFYFESSEQNDG